MLFDYFLISIRNLTSRRTRTVLTMIGIFIGIAAIVSLISIGQGMRIAINEQFNQLGTDKLMIFPGGESGVPGGTFGSEAKKLTDDDMNVVKGVSGIKDAGGMAYGVARLKYGDVSKYAFIIGLPLDSSRKVIESMQSLKVADGRDLQENDKSKMTVGSELSKGTFFGTPVMMGEKIMVNDAPYRVVGFMEPVGNPSDDSQVYMPLEEVRKLLNKGNALDYIIAQVVQDSDIDQVKSDVQKALRRFRNVKQGQEDFSVQTTAQLMQTLDVVLNVIEIVFIGIAAISLVVGGIGIMNTMYTSVLERTTEIGIMKAIGARNFDITAIFVVESGLLGMLGGGIGIILGIALSKGIEYITSAVLGVTYLKAYFPLYLVLGALGFSFIVGCLAGGLPALRASRLNPVEALRYE